VNTIHDIRLKLPEVHVSVRYCKEYIDSVYVRYPNGSIADITDLTEREPELERHIWSEIRADERDRRDYAKQMQEEK